MDPYRYPSYNLANFGLPSALVAAPDPTHLVLGSPAVGPPCQPQMTRCWYRQIQSKTVCLISIPWCSKNKSHKPIIWTICIYIYILVHHILEAAQRALRDASRRRKLAATVVSNPADKRSRAPATSSTKVTPDGKKQCSSSVVADNLQPRCLSFSDDVTAGQVDDTILFFHFEIRSI